MDPELDSEPADRWRARYERLAVGRATGLPIAVAQRFFHISGLDMGGLLALELFTVSIPLILLGFSYASGFSSEVSFGDALIRQLDLDGSSAELVRSAFGDGASLRGTWTIIGLAGFLVWGVPMASQVARVFAAAWQRERFPFHLEALRGAAWFGVYLLSLAAMDSSYAASLDERSGGIGGQGAGLVVVFVLWAVSPVILVRDGAVGWPALLKCGVAGMVVSAVLRLAAQLVLPPLLSGWVGFGPIGVAMALMTWCGITAIGWVVIACVGAVVWERSVAIGVAVATNTEA